MNCRSFCKLFTAREGATAVEFALITIPFLMIVLGTVEFGRLIWIRQAIEATATH